MPKCSCFSAPHEREVETLNSISPFGMEAETFKLWRSQEIDEMETKQWTTTEESFQSVGAVKFSKEMKQRIRNGVPDTQKRWVLIKAHYTERWLQKCPNYYRHILHLTFGARIPDKVKGRVPTFSAGFEGTETDILRGLNLNGNNELDMDILSEDSSVSESLIASQSSQVSVISNRFDETSSTTQSHASHAATDVDNSLLYSLYKYSNPVAAPWPNPQQSPATASYYLEEDSNFLAYTRSPGVLDDNGINSLEHVTHLYRLLNEEGINACKRILWALNYVFQEIEFCPIIPNLTCILLIYTSETETFFILYCFISEAIRRAKDGRKHLIMCYKREEFGKLVLKVMAIVKAQSKKLYDHLLKLDYNLYVFISRALQDGLSKFLPFNYLLRIFVSFLFEGVKTIIRYLVGFLKFHEHSLLASKTKNSVTLVFLSFRHRKQTVQMISALQKLTYKRRFHSEGKTNLDSLQIPHATNYLNFTSYRRLHRPSVLDASNVIKDEEWEILWNWISLEFHIMRPDLVYSSTKDGMSITALLRATLHHKGKNPQFLFLKGNDEEVVGAFLPFPIKSDQNFLEQSPVNLSTSFVFCLHPAKAAYWWTGKHCSIINLSHHNISIGVDQPALCIDSDILFCFSGPCSSYSSPSLIANEQCFISFLEIWMLS